MGSGTDPDYRINAPARPANWMQMSEAEKIEWYFAWPGQINRQLIENILRSWRASFEIQQLIKDKELVRERLDSYCSNPSLKDDLVIRLLNNELTRINSEIQQRAQV